VHEHAFPLMRLLILMPHPRNSNLYSCFLGAASSKLHLPEILQKTVQE